MADDSGSGGFVVLGCSVLAESSGAGVVDQVEGAVGVCQTSMPGNGCLTCHPAKVLIR